MLCIFSFISLFFHFDVANKSANSAENVSLIQNDLRKNLPSLTSTHLKRDDRFPKLKRIALINNPAGYQTFRGGTRVFI